MSEPRPKLARKARLRRDKKTGKHLLLYPERGLLLNEVGTFVVARLDGSRDLEAIADELARETGADVATVRADVSAFVASLRERGLLDE